MLFFRLQFNLKFKGNNVSNHKITVEKFIKDFQVLSKACEIMNSEENKTAYMNSLKKVSTIHLLSKFNLIEATKCIQKVKTLNELFENIQLTKDKPTCFSQAYFTNISIYQKRLLLENSTAFKQIFFEPEIAKFLKVDDIEILPDLHSVIAYFTIALSKGTTTIQEKNIIETPYGTVEFQLDICSEEFIKSLYELEKMAAVYSQSQTFKNQATYENFLQKSMAMNHFMNSQILIPNNDYFLLFSNNYV